MPRNGPPENFVSLERVVEAAAAQGFLQATSGSMDVAPLIGQMTGLDMAKYDLVLDAHWYGWRIAKKAAHGAA